MTGQSRHFSVPASLCRPLGSANLHTSEQTTDTVGCLNVLLRCKLESSDVDSSSNGISTEVFLKARATSREGSHNRIHMVNSVPSVWKTAATFTCGRAFISCRIQFYGGQCTWELCHRQEQTSWSNANCPFLTHKPSFCAQKHHAESSQLTLFQGDPAVVKSHSLQTFDIFPVLHLLRQAPRPSNVACGLHVMSSL